MPGNDAGGELTPVDDNGKVASKSVPIDGSGRARGEPMSGDDSAPTPSNVELESSPHQTMAVAKPQVSLCTMAQCV